MTKSLGIIDSFVSGEFSYLMELYIKRNPDKIFTVTITLNTINFLEDKYFENEVHEHYIAEISNGKDLLCWICREVCPSDGWPDRIHKKLLSYDTKLVDELIKAKIKCDI